MIFIFSGCFTKQVDKIVVKKEFIYEKPYIFEKIDLQGTYIELNSKQVQRLCTPPLIELNDVYKGVIEYYDWQIDSYADKNTSKG